MPQSRSIQREPDAPSYRLDADGATVRVGNPARYGGRCGPHLRVERWGGERWLELRAMSVDPDVFPERVRPNSRGGDVLEIQAVRTDASGKRRGEVHRFESGSTEWSIEWASPADAPPNGIIWFEVNFSDGLEWRFQRPLTAPELDQGASAGAGVEGSYVCYGDRRGRFVDRRGLEWANYETGRFAQIFRPRAIDADGAAVWADQFLDPLAGKLRVELPLDWLRQARYPVTLDPTIGYTSVGGYSISLSPNYIYSNGPFTGADGWLLSMSQYLGVSASVSATMACYADASGRPGARVAQTAGTILPTGTNWKTLNFTSQPAISSGAVYYPALSYGTSNVTHYYDILNLDWWQIPRTYQAGNMPDPFPSGSGGQPYYVVSAYFTYTVDPPGQPAARRLGRGVSGQRGVRVY